jgi:hypothetical protein
MHHPYSGLVNVDLNKSYYPTGESPSVVFFIIVSIFLGFCISTQILQRTVVSTKTSNAAGLLNEIVPNQWNHFGEIDAVFNFFFYSYVHTMFGSFLHPYPRPLPY